MKEDHSGLPGRDCFSSSTIPRACCLRLHLLGPVLRASSAPRPPEVHKSDSLPVRASVGIVCTLICREDDVGCIFLSGSDITGDRVFKTLLGRIIEQLQLITDGYIPVEALNYSVKHSTDGFVSRVSLKRTASDRKAPTLAPVIPLP